MAEASSSSTRPLRQPAAHYIGFNGFVDPVRHRMTGSGPPPKTNLHAVAAAPERATREQLNDLRDAVQRRQAVENIMELGGTYFPGMDAIRRMNEIPETPAAVQGRIEQLQKKLTEDVRKLYEWHAQDYYDEMLDLSRSKPDIDDPGVEAFYKDSRSAYDMASAFDDELDAHMHAHLRAVYPLRKQHAALLVQEEADQRKRDQQFPQDIAAFDAIRNPEVKLRIARFLAGDDVMQEKMMDQFQWRWLICKALVGHYKENKTFKEQIEKLLQAYESRDPRTRTPANPGP